MEVLVNPYVAKYVKAIRKAAEESNIDKLVLFGSSITEYFQFFSSDIDIYIEASLENRIEFEEKLYEIINFKYSVDVISKDMLIDSPELALAIERGFVIYEKNIA